MLFVTPMRQLSHDLLSVDIHNRQADCFLACPGLWVQVWTQLLTDVVSDPISKQMTMVDILNEPDSRGLGCVAGLQAFTTS